MFETLTSKLEGIFNNLKKAPSLNKAQVETGLKEIRQALLAADVALPVVKKFIEDIRPKVAASIFDNDVNLDEPQGEAELDTSVDLDAE